MVAERPNDFGTRIHLAELLIDDKLHGEALRVVEDALRLQPDNSEALRIYAILLYENDSFEQAREALERAALKGTADPKSEMLLSRVYLKLGKVWRADELYNQAVKHDPSLADSSYLRSIASAPASRPVTVTPEDENRGIDFESERGARISFDDVGGMSEVKELLRMNIILPLKNPNLFREYGKKVGGGVLMYGPPGCGKTYLSRALAGECDATFYNVGIHEILDMFLGSSEKNMHNLFETARRNAPAILFIDEIDALGQKRGSDSWGRALRGTVDTLLTEMDSLGGPDKSILVIGATNTPWSVDLALRRPGRFDRVIFVPPPDQKAREEILKLHLRGKPTADLDIPRVASKLEKFSGADISAAIDRAVEGAIKQAMLSGKTELITTKNLLDAANGMRPSTTEWLATAYDYVRYSNEGGVYDQVKAYLDKNP